MVRATNVALAVALGVAGCEAGFSPAIVRTSPPNRATAVDVTLSPAIEVGEGAVIDPSERRILLYDVTGGARSGLGGAVEVVGTTATFLTEEPLPVDHDYELELVAGAVGGDRIDPIDEAEWPREPLTWPYRLRFSTRTGPRVRAAYLERGDRPRVHVYFSQAMNLAVTGPEIRVRDMGHEALAAGEPVWSELDRASIELADPLDPIALYTLEVGRGSLAATGTALDGDDDGNPGEVDDDFVARFTGSQEVIRSRLK